MSHPLIIAIDGPSGAGKSTLGRMLARALHLPYLDTGSMYRAVALAVMESSVSASDDVAVGSPGLLLHRAHHVGEKPFEPELLAVFVGERGRAVVHRVVEEKRPAQAHLDPLPAAGAVLAAVRLH